MILTAFFSATGRTAKAAERLAAVTGADLYEIKPETPYTKADLNWMNKKSRSSVEMSDKSSRPAIGGDKVEDMSKYDTILLLAPIWWYQFPTICNTFLESYDFSGKKIILFATSGSSGLGDSAAFLKGSAPGAEIIDGEMLNRVNTDEKMKQIADKYL